MKSASSGFTLIEMSIVLVIIGLIVGGILVGQNLIAAAQMRQEVAQLEKWSTAVNTFKTKYDCLPGDCSNIQTFFPTAVPVGNGNGVIEITDFGVVGDSEATWSFIDLSLAGLIPYSLVSTTCAPGLGIPQSIIDPNSGYTLFTASMSGTDTLGGGSSQYIGDGNNWFRMIYGTSAGCYAGTQSPTYWGFTGAQLYQLDLKFDDGLPLSGNIMVGGYDDWSQGSSVQTVCSAGSNTCGVLFQSACVVGATNVYQTNGTVQSCPILKRAY